jgi:NCS1 family nucleobase:cation symporter-1
MVERMTTTSDADAAALADYGDSITSVEPGGVERIPLGERHGRPSQLLWTWSSPNLEFATIYVGVIAVAFFGLSFWQAVLALVIGNALGGLTQGVLSSWGPRHGLPQMVISRSAFGYWGNLLPAGLNAVMAGIGWFAVNSVSGALALAALTGWSSKLTLLIVVALEVIVAFFGHNLVQAFERYVFPILVVFFLLGAIAILHKAHPGAAVIPGGPKTFAGFTVTISAAFGYAAGWNPYAADYTRYLPRDVDRTRVGLFAGLGNFVSCSVLMIVGAASVTIGAKSSGNPAGDLTGVMPHWIGNLVLLGIALGAISANALNIYSGAMSFLAMGIHLPLAWRRAIVGVGFGAIGLVLAWNGLKDAGDKYENFLLIIAYWIAPWLGVVLTDRWLRRGTDIDHLLTDTRYVNLAGPIAMIVGMAVSIWLFSDQTKYVGPLAKAHSGALGDLTPLVGLVLAAVVYAGLRSVLKPSERAEPA